MSGPLQPGTAPPPLGGGADPHDSVRWSAVLIGVGIDFFATLAATLAIYSMAAMIAASRGSQGDAEAYIQQLQRSPDFIMTFLLVGMLCVSFGAYVAARRAGYAYLRHAILVGVGSITLTLVLDNLPGNEPDPEAWNPTWFRTLGYLLVIPFAALGGAFAERMEVGEDDSFRS